jgi:hypothetical protein
MTLAYLPSVLQMIAWQMIAWQMIARLVIRHGHSCSINHSGQDANE